MDEKLLPAVQKAYDINRWLLPQVEKFTRAYKFTLGDRLQTTALDLCTALVEAGHSRSKDRPLYRADRLLDQLRILLRLARDLDLISARRHAYACIHVEELGGMIGGWLRATRDHAGGHAIDDSRVGA
jgi:hypothetical protein